MLNLNVAKAENMLKNVADSTAIKNTLLDITSKVKIDEKLANEVDIGKITGNNINMNILQDNEGKAVSKLSQLFKGIFDSDLSSKQKADAAAVVASGSGALLAGADIKNNKSNVANIMSQYDKQEINLQQYISQILTLDQTNKYRVGEISGNNIDIISKQLSSGYVTNDQIQESTQKNDSSVSNNQSDKLKTTMKMSTGQVFAMIFAVILIVVIVIIAIKFAKKHPAAQGAELAGEMAPVVASQLGQMANKNTNESAQQMSIPPVNIS